MNTDLTRRQAITAMTATAAGVAGLTSIAPAATLRTTDFGYNPKTNQYELPPLPYDHDALAPHIDVITMTIHHTKHHAGYVRGLNNALTKLEELRNGQGDASTIQHWQRQLAFHAGGHINHTLFWTGMAPANAGGGGTPNGSLAKAIDRDFGSYEKFKSQFLAASKSVEASGWGWLIYEPIAQRLMIAQMQNQQDMLVTGAVPLLGVDVWEHAYYLSYQNRRADYLKAFMNVVNWGEVQKRYDAAIS